MEKGNSSKIKTVFEISAGGVLFKMEDKTFFVLLIATKNHTVWTLPKGLIEKGEDPETAAIREVKEETGCLGKIVKLIDKIDIWFYSKENDEKTRHHKLIYYYLMKFVEGDTAQHDYEVDDAKWFNIDEAISVATYPKDRVILEKAKSLLYENPDLYSG